MEFILSLTIAIELIAIGFALATLFTKDNLYAAIYLAITTTLIASLYAIANAHFIFLLLMLIYVGAVIIITIVLAATYRYVEPRSVKVSYSWLIPSIIITALTLALFTVGVTGNVWLSPVKEFTKVLTDFLNTNIFTVSMLVLLIVVLGIAMVKLYRETGIR